MIYKTEHLANPAPDDIAQVLTMFRKIPGRTCSAANYLDYLQDNWSNVAIFVVKRDDKIVGFTQAEAPSILDPKCAWLPFSYLLPGISHKDSVGALELAEQWMKEKGATKWKMATVRRTDALKKAWGVVKSKEILMEKDIECSTTNLNIT